MSSHGVGAVPLRGLRRPTPEYAMRTKTILPALGCAVLAAFSSLHAATITWTAEKDGRWNVSGNWSSDPALPGSSDRVNISDPNPGYTVTVDTPGAAANTVYLGLAGQHGSLLLKNGGTLAVAGSLYLAYDTNGSRGTITQEAGSTVTVGTSLYFGRYTSGRKGYYTMNGGTLTVGSTIRLANQGDGYFYQKGGSVTAGTLYTYTDAAGAGSTVGLYEISGGTLSLTNLNNGVLAENVTRLSSATFRVVGSAATINVSGNYLQRDSTKVFLAYDMDDGGVSRINLTGSGTATLDGSLEAGFKGGVALTATNRFHLIEADTGNISGAFDALPNAALWNAPTIEAISESRDALVLSLNEAASLGSLALNPSEMAELHFDATSLGYVELSNVTPDSSLWLYLAADAGSGQTVSDLLDYFTGNGINAAFSDREGFDLRLQYSGVTAGDPLFAFDLSPFNSTATLSGLGLMAVPEPSGLALSVLGAAGLAFLYRRKKDVRKGA